MDEYKKMNATKIQEFHSNDQYFWFIANFEQLKVKNVEEINVVKIGDEQKEKAANDGEEIELSFREILEEKIEYLNSVGIIYFYANLSKLILNSDWWYGEAFGPSPDGIDVW